MYLARNELMPNEFFSWIHLKKNIKVKTNPNSSNYETFKDLYLSDERLIHIICFYHLKLWAILILKSVRVKSTENFFYSILDK